MADYAYYVCLLVCLSPCQSAGELIYRTGGVLLRIIMFATTENDPCLARQFCRTMVGRTNHPTRWRRHCSVLRGGTSITRGKNMARLGPCLGNASQVAEEEDEKKVVLIERSPFIT